MAVAGAAKFVTAPNSLRSSSDDTMSAKREISIMPPIGSKAGRETNGPDLFSESECEQSGRRNTCSEVEYKERATIN
jgi:hypothetical protein